MKKLFQLLPLAAAMVISLSATGLTQDVDRTSQTIDPSPRSSDTEARIVALAGCLERGSGAEEYSLRSGVDLWELKSTSVNLAGHLDQMVVVTAISTNDPYGTLNVINLKTDSPSCNL